MEQWECANTLATKPKEALLARLREFLFFYKSESKKPVLSLLLSLVKVLTVSSLQPPSGKNFFSLAFHPDSDVRGTWYAIDRIWIYDCRLGQLKRLLVHCHLALSTPELDDKNVLLMMTFISFCVTKSNFDSILRSCDQDLRSYLPTRYHIQSFSSFYSEFITETLHTWMLQHGLLHSVFILLQRKDYTQSSEARRRLDQLRSQAVKLWVNSLKFGLAVNDGIIDRGIKWKFKQIVTLLTTNLQGGEIESSDFSSLRFLLSGVSDYVTGGMFP